MGEGVYRGLFCNSVARGLVHNSRCEGKIAVEVRKDGAGDWSYNCAVAIESQSQLQAEPFQGD